jgi:carboxylate-amine ligase
VETAAGEWAARQPTWRSEELRAAHWRAARYGMSDSLVHPVEGGLRPATEVLSALIEAVRPALDRAGDLDWVRAAAEQAVPTNGATRQRAAYERTGDVAGVVDDLIERTERSWQAHDTASSRP